MTIYWERCSICRKHKPVRQCTLWQDDMVCAECCLLCSHRGSCPAPAWFGEFRTAVPVSERRREEARKALEDLLKRLESGST